MEENKKRRKEEMSETKEEESLSEGKETIEEQTEPSQEVDKIKEKLSQIENQYLRLLADYQNLQKRTTSEKEELYKYAAQKTIEAMLPALDTFEYAKATVNPESSKEKLIEDFNLVFETLLKCLKDMGLEPIEETGIPFDPFFHEPLHQIPTNELPDHTVMQVLKKGYMLNKKVIRPALVSVSIKEVQNKEKNEEKWWLVLHCGLQAYLVPESQL